MFSVSRKGVKPAVVKSAVKPEQEIDTLDWSKVKITIIRPDQEEEMVEEEIEGEGE